MDKLIAGVVLYAIVGWLVYLLLRRRATCNHQLHAARMGGLLWPVTAMITGLLILKISIKKRKPHDYT